VRQKLSWFDKVMAAVTFAEANDYKTAKELIGKTVKQAQKDLNEPEAILTDLHGAEVR
jgi:pyruvate kinase